MGLFNWLQKTSSKANEALDQTKKDISETAGKIQLALDESSNGVKKVVGIITIALGISILTNIITIGLNISNHRNNKNAVVIHNLYLGEKR